MDLTMNVSMMKNQVTVYTQMRNEEINDSEGTEGESQGIDIYDVIRKEIQRVIDSENPNDKGKDDLEDYYESRDIKGEV